MINHTTPPPEMDGMALSDDVLREILLRVPPLPTPLIRAAAVCRRWRRIAAEPGFLRRYRAHHGKPPLLGFFVNPRGREPLFRATLDSPDRVPPQRFSLRLHDDTELGGNWYYHGCRHGRLLLVNWKSGLGCRQILIWDPFSGDLRHLSPPPQLDALKGVFFQATVICAAAAGDHVHGDDCKSSPFKVVLVGTDRTRAFAFVYSSETGDWGDDGAQTPVGNCISLGSRCIQIGDFLYWMLFGYDNNILEFDLIWQHMIDFDGVAGWLPIEPIYLDNLLHLSAGECVNPTKVLGFSQDYNELFVASTSRIFMVNLESLQFKELCNMDEFLESPESRPIYAVYPFASFYDAGSSSSSA